MIDNNRTDFGKLRGCGAIFRLDCEGHDGAGHVHGGHHELVCAVREGVAAVAVHSKHGAYLAARCFRDVLHLVAVHAHQAGYLSHKLN